MRKPFLTRVGCVLGVLLGFLVIQDRPQLVEESVEWVQSLRREESPSALILLVPDRSGVAAVRAAVDPARILAETPDAIVLREGRVVATGPEVVGPPLMAAGFADRSIELWAPSPREAQERRRGDDGELSLAELAKKPTLTPFEVMAILNGSVPGAGI